MLYDFRAGREKYEMPNLQLVYRTEFLIGCCVPVGGFGVSASLVQSVRCGTFLDQECLMERR